jgi:hypothetical protein
MKRKETAKKVSGAAAEKAGEKLKSKTRLFWEKHPDGIGWKIVNMRSVLK